MAVKEFKKGDIVYLKYKYGDYMGQWDKRDAQYIHSIGPKTAILKSFNLETGHIGSRGWTYTLDTEETVRYYLERNRDGRNSMPRFVSANWADHLLTISRDGWDA